MQYERRSKRYGRAAARLKAEFAEIAAEHRQGNADASEVDFVVRNSNRAILIIAFGTLSEKDQDVLRMRQVMEYREIAAAERITEQAARVRYKRALDRLKQAIVEGSQNGQET